MIWFWIALGVVLGVPLVLWLIGSRIPRDHLACVEIELAASPERVFALIAQIEDLARWRDDVKQIEILPSVDGRKRYREHGKHGAIGFELVSQEAPRRQVVRALDEDQLFGGQWHFELTPRGSGTRLAITEAGFVKSPIFRAIGAVFFSPSATLLAYQSAPARELGEAAEPRPIQPAAPRS